MKSTPVRRRVVTACLRTALTLSLVTLCGRADSCRTADLPPIIDSASLDRAISGSTDGAQQAALQANRNAILAAAAKRPHIAAVIDALTKAGGKYEVTNTTPEGLQKAFGGPLPLFETLRLVNLSDPKLGIKAKRETDPFDHEFYAHLGHIPDIWFLTILNTTAQNDDLLEVAKLIDLKQLNITNQSKMNDEGLAHLSGLKKLERLNFVGTSMTGHPFRDFTGWTALRAASFRGSKIDDEGLAQLCAHFPDLESLVLAHAAFTDAGATALASLHQLKNFEIGTQKATAACLRNIAGLPLEYLQLGEELGHRPGIDLIKGMSTLRRLTITDAKPLSDDDLAVIAGMKQLEHLELGSLELADHLPALQSFGFLKSMRLVRYSNPYTPEIRGRVQAALPGVKIAFD